jgi:hypothetical protein
LFAGFVPSVRVGAVTLAHHPVECEQSADRIMH